MPDVDEFRLSETGGDVCQWLPVADDGHGCKTLCRVCEILKKSRLVPGFLCSGQEFSRYPQGLSENKLRSGSVQILLDCGA